MSNHAAASKRKKRVVLVTGASSGIGRITAERFAAAGNDVFGTSRHVTASAPDGVRMLTLDVRDDDSVRACVDAVVAAAGPVDVLVSNAGHMVFGPVEEVASTDAHAMFETNFWGAARVVSAVLPGMRERRGGHVVLISSIAATAAIPLNGYYAASKAALGRYAEALRHEVMDLGVRVSLVEPSDYRTRFWESALFAAGTIADYAPIRARVRTAIASLVADAPEPSPVADAIVRVAESAHPASVVRVGAWARRLPRMRAWMPAALFERGVRRRFGLDS